jgi:hypothetical protein
MKELPAKKKKGFLLYNPFEKTYFFRIYHPKDKRKYKDYDLRIEELEIEIICNWASLYNKEHQSYLDWSSKVLGHNNDK